MSDGTTTFHLAPCGRKEFQCENDYSNIRNSGEGENRNYRLKHKLASHFTLHTSLKKTYRPNGLTSYHLKKCAFTLAEVLITLGIIGVVAAMTIPTLISNHQKKQTVAQLKTAYSLFSRAIFRAAADNEAPVHWNYNDATSFSNEYIFPYMNIIKDCGFHSEAVFCYGNLDDEKNMLHLLNGDVVNSAGYKSFILSNGMGVLIRLGHGSAGATSFIKFYVDVNGKKGNNILGKDVFAFSMRPDWGDRYIFTVGVNGANSSGVNNSSYLKDRDYLMSDVRGGCSKTAASESGYLQGDFCSLLILIDGWEIKDGYPW